MPKRKPATSESESEVPAGEIEADLKKVKIVKDDATDDSIATITPRDQDNQENEPPASDKKEDIKPSPKKKAKTEEPEKQADDTAVTPIPSAKTTMQKIRLLSWNVNGARALHKKKEWFNFIKKAAKDPTVMGFGLQETKCDGTTFPADFDGKKLGFSNHYLNSSATKKGYSGTCIYTRQKPISKTFGIGMQSNDSEGRVICSEFEKFYFITAYVMNSGQGLKRLDERTKKFEPKMRKYLKNLDEKKPIIYCGDLNVACSEIELANPKSNYNKTSGYTQVEIDEFFKMVEELKLVDTFRMLYPDKKGCYTYWGYRANARARNVGWRLDYFMVSERIKDSIVDVIHHTNVQGSDHCPIELVVDLAKID